MIKRHLRADADGLHDDEVEARQLLQGLAQRLGGFGLWLAMIVTPEYQSAEPPLRTPEQAQQFLRDLQFADAPIEILGVGTATYRQPGGVVMTEQAAIAAMPHWWRLAMQDSGQAVGAHVLTHEIAADPLSGDKKWFGLPPGVTEKPTVPVRRDEIEIRPLTLLDLLTAHASTVDAGGRVLVMAALVGCRDEADARVTLLDEIVDQNGNRQGWRQASAGANRPLADAVMVPVIHLVRLAEMRDPAARVRAAYRVAAELLAIFAIDRPTMLTAEGTLDPDGAATDHSQQVYQHAQHLGLPVGPVSPIERQQRLEAAIRAAQDEYRRR